MATSKDLNFKTIDGLVLGATLFSAGNNKPCIIMSSGFSGLKEHFLPDFASRFQAEGYTVLIYDNRCWGTSEGLPRNHVDPQLQTRDYLDAFDFASTLPDVDPVRIIFWGSSMSGGNAICAAALEKRVRAVIAQVPFVSGELASGEFASLMPMFLEERGAVRRGAAPTLVPIIPESMEEALSGASKAILKEPATIIFDQEMARRQYTREKFVTLQSSLALVLHEPRAVIHRVAPAAILMVVAENDITIPTPGQLAMYEQASEPKTLHVVKNTGHFDLYYGPAFEENIKVQLGFLETIV